MDTLSSLEPVTDPPSRDELGDRMKSYEHQGQTYLVRDTPICIRIDGRAFHTFARGLERPMDPRLAALMVSTTRRLMEETHAVVGFTQSDEISLVLMRESPDAIPYFGGRLQKMVSILAAVASVHFNRELPKYIPEKAHLTPTFDARVWNVPDEDEAANTILWRELDAYKNGVSALAWCFFSHSDLQNKGRSDMLQMLADRGIDPAKYAHHLFNGTFLFRRTKSRPYTTTEMDKLPVRHAARTDPNLMVTRQDIVTMDALPPLIRMANRVGVLFQGEVPLLLSSIDAQKDLPHDNA